jgi:hypothetical protein
MKRWFASAFIAVFTVSLTVATIPAALAAPQSAATQSASTGKSHGTFTVELTKPLDSKKLKDGDPVEAKLTGGISLPNGTPVARGAKVIGHVTESKARSKGDSQSSLGITFDKIVLGAGEDEPIKGVAQAAAPNPNGDLATGGAVDYGNSLKAAAATPAAPDMSRPAVKLLTDQSVGVQGIKNLELGADGVFTSSGKEVKLDNGTRILLNVTM